MKKRIALIGLLYFNYSVFAQNNTKIFSWNDTVFTVRSKRMIHIYYSVGNGSLDTTSYRVIDTIIRFMKKNPELKIAINSHLDQQGDYKMNMGLSQARSQSIVNKCILRGKIDSVRLVPCGYGSKYPIIPMSQINTMKNKRKKDSLYQINRRTEVEIIATDYK